MHFYLNEVSRKRIIKKTNTISSITPWWSTCTKAVQPPLPSPEVTYLPKLASMIFKVPKGKLFITQLPLSTDRDLERDLWRSTEAGDLDLLEEVRF